VREMAGDDFFFTFFAEVRNARPVDLTARGRILIQGGKINEMVV
jgi:hypothetical protein